MKYCVTTTGLNSAKNGLKNDSVSLSWSHQRPPGSTYYQFKKIEIVSSIFSDHNAMRLDINYRKNICKKYKHMEAKQYVTK